MKHPYFGELAERPGEASWEGVIERAGRGVPVTLTTDGDATAAQLDAVAAFPRELPRFDALARAALALGLREGGDVRDYIEHHLTELSEDALQSIFATTSTITPDQFLAAMVLRGVSLRPEALDAAAVFDYSIDPRATQYVLAVGFDASGEVASIAMES